MQILTPKLQYLFDEDLFLSTARMTAQTFYRNFTFTRFIRIFPIFVLNLAKLH